MHARMFTALFTAATLGAFACAPALAQSAMPASSSSTTAPDAMHQGGMREHQPMMKKDAMQHGTMMRKKDAMQHGTMMTKHDDAMKMKKADSAPASSGG